MLGRQQYQIYNLKENTGSLAVLQNCKECNLLYSMCFKIHVTISPEGSAFRTQHVCKVRKDPSDSISNFISIFKRILGKQSISREAYLILESDVKICYCHIMFAIVSVYKIIATS